MREFRPLFGTFLLSTAGDELARVALTVLVFQRTNSPLLSALTFAISHLPWLLGGPVLSALADRLPRHRVLIAADVVRALLLACMAIPGMPLPVLLALLLLVSLCAPPFESARSALMADVLEGDRYAVATSLTNVAAAARPGGRLPRGRGAGRCFTRRAALLVDAVTFAVSALWLARGLQRRPAPTAEGGGGPRSLWRDTADGVAPHRPFAPAARGHRACCGWRAVRQRLRGRRRAAGRGARQRGDGDRRAARRLPRRHRRRWPASSGRLVPPRRRERPGRAAASSCPWPRCWPAGPGGRSLGDRRPSPSPSCSACCSSPASAAPGSIPLNVSFVQAGAGGLPRPGLRVAVSGAVRRAGPSARRRPGSGPRALAPSGVVACPAAVGLIARRPAGAAPAFLRRTAQRPRAAVIAAEGPSRGMSESSRSLPSARTFYDEVGGAPTFRALVDALLRRGPHRPGAARRCTRRTTGPAPRPGCAVPRAVLGRSDDLLRGARPPAAAHAARAVRDRPGRARRLAAPHARRGRLPGPRRRAGRRALGYLEMAAAEP